MAWIFNPFTKSLNYYEPGLPEGGTSGKILTVNDTEDGFEWVEPTDTIGNVIISKPDESGLRVTNIYVDANTGKTVVEYEDTYSSDVAEVISNPPTGHYRVTNIYIDANANKTTVEYDTIPVE